MIFLPKGAGKNGIELGKEHVEALTRYLQNRPEAPLPRYGAELNRSAIAKACGFDRKIFQTNPVCKRLLDEADVVDRRAQPSRLDRAEAVREENAKTDADRAQLEADNLRLMAENASLRREVERWRRLNAIMTQTGKLP